MLFLKKFKSIYLRTEKIINYENELWINYSAGVNTSYNLARSKTPWYLTGIIPRSIIFVIWLFKRVKFKPINISNNLSEILVFSQTLNQLNSLKSVIDSFHFNDISYCNLIDVDLRKNVDINTNYEISFIPFSVAILSFYLCCVRFKKLYKTLNSKEPDLIKRRLNSFLEIYVWIPYFLNKLSNCKPTIVLMSNDHNPANRSLLLVCKKLGIKTAYLQHASVSSRFHRLEFDYSFLDGYSALKAYLNCEKNSLHKQKRLPQRCIFLTGIKRSLNKADPSIKDVGIAIKNSDNLNEIVKIAKFLGQHGRNVHIRFHPASLSNLIRDLNYLASKNPYIFISNPSVEPVNKFFKKMGSVIASNSSILLEARLSGIRSIYMEFGNVSVTDYYGFVASKISIECRSSKDLLAILNLPVKDDNEVVSSLRSYSHTYLTDWENKEGELTSNILASILNAEPITEQWGFVNFSL